eukprot:NODE_782_length_3919_cov_0.611518.p2 type:complete len:287 gc:universal NODE_782_length_3919_cov_0.611518:1521-661(-)
MNCDIFAHFHIMLFDKCRRHLLPEMMTTLDTSEMSRTNFKITHILPHLLFKQMAKVFSEIEHSNAAVLVKNISKQANEDIVKDFFSFCGSIQHFEMIESDDTFSALIVFDKDSAANTAKLLTNAVIVDSQVQVTSYFEQSSSQAKGGVEQVVKPALHTVAQLLAAGYGLSDTIINRAKTFDSNIGLTATLSHYAEQAKEEVMKLENRYHLLETVQTQVKSVDERFGVSKTANDLYEKTSSAATNVANQALSTAPGQYVQGGFNYAKEKAGEVQKDAEQLREKKEVK